MVQLKRLVGCPCPCPCTLSALATESMDWRCVECCCASSVGVPLPFRSLRGGPLCEEGLPLGVAGLGYAVALASDEAGEMAALVGVMFLPTFSGTTGLIGSSYNPATSALAGPDTISPSGCLRADDKGALLASVAAGLGLI